MSYTETMVQRLAIVDAVHSQSLGTGNTNMAAVDTLYFSRLMYILDVGTLGTNANVQFGLQGSPVTTSANFANITGFSGSSVNTVSAANSIVKVGIKAEDLGSQTGGVGSFPNYGRYVRGLVIVNANASQVCCIALGAVGRWKPESVVGSKEIAAVTQTVSDSTNG